MTLHSFLCTSIVVVISGVVGAAEPTVSPKPKEIRLWPDGAPGAKFDDDGDRPSLTLYHAKSEVPTAAVVVCPGGGYRNLAMGHEGHQIAKWLQSLNVTAGICKYRHRGQGNGGKGYGHPAPLQDVQRAIRLMRTNATKWNLDPKQIGVLGFSAGGHLASTISTHFDLGNPQDTDSIEQTSCRPDFAILCYPVIGFDKSYTHLNSQRNLLGESPDLLLLQDLSNENRVTKETPPTFIWATTEDLAVPPENSVQYYLALIRQKVPAELHLFERGGHGLGNGADTPGVRSWPSLCENWMRIRGLIHD